MTGYEGPEVFATCTEGVEVASEDELAQPQRNEERVVLTSDTAFCHNPFDIRINIEIRVHSGI